MSGPFSEANPFADARGPFAVAHPELPPTFSVVPGRVLGELDLQTALAPVKWRFTARKSVSAGSSLGDALFLPGATGFQGPGDRLFNGTSYSLGQWVENSWHTAAYNLYEVTGYLPLVFGAHVRISIPSDTPASAYTVSFWKTTLSGLVKIYEMSLQELISAYQTQGNIFEFRVRLDRFVAMTISSAATSAAGGNVDVIYEVRPLS